MTRKEYIKSRLTEAEFVLDCFVESRGISIDIGATFYTALVVMGAIVDSSDESEMFIKELAKELKDANLEESRLREMLKGSGS